MVGKHDTYSLNFPPWRQEGCSAMLSLTLQKIIHIRYLKQINNNLLVGVINLNPQNAKRFCE